MKKAYLLFTSIFMTICTSSIGQAVAVPFTAEHWNMEGAQITHETYLGKDCIKFNAGTIVSKNIDLRDGVIEFDLSFPQKRGFPGVSFRVQDMGNLEHFYVRPH